MVASTKHLVPRFDKANNSKSTIHLLPEKPNFVTVEDTMVLKGKFNNSLHQKKRKPI